MTNSTIHSFRNSPACSSGLVAVGVSFAKSLPTCCARTTSLPWRKRSSALSGHVFSGKSVRWEKKNWFRLPFPCLCFLPTILWHLVASSRSKPPICFWQADLGSCCVLCRKSVYSKLGFLNFGKSPAWFRFKKSRSPRCISSAETSSPTEPGVELAWLKRWVFSWKLVKWPQSRKSSAPSAEAMSRVSVWSLKRVAYTKPRT